MGGGSVFIAFKQRHPQANFWINDLNPEVFTFWSIAQSHLDDLIAQVMTWKQAYSNGRELFTFLTDRAGEEWSERDRAARFFVLNRITFSGTIESGGYSEGAFKARFTESSIQRLAQLGKILTDVKITNLDYSEVVNAPGEDVFMFLDPPYYSVKKSKLYGKKGDLHTQFDDEQFAQIILNCPHDWLITYDDAPYIRTLFATAHIAPWQLQYGMNNYKQAAAEKGNELFIRNYPLTLGLPLRSTTLLRKANANAPQSKNCATPAESIQLTLPL